MVEKMGFYAWIIKDTSGIELIKRRIKDRINILPERLTLLHEKKGISLTDLCNTTGISKSYLSMIENGRQAPSIDALLKLYDVYDASIDFITGRTKITNRYTAGSGKEHLRKVRIDAGCTQCDIARLLGYHTDTPICRQETNGIAMTLYRLEIFAEFFDVPIDYVLGLTDDKYRYKSFHFYERGDYKKDMPRSIL